MLFLNVLHWIMAIYSPGSAELCGKTVSKSVSLYVCIFSYFLALWEKHWLMRRTKYIFFFSMLWSRLIQNTGPHLLSNFKYLPLFKVNILSKSFFSFRIYLFLSQDSLKKTQTRYMQNHNYSKLQPIQNLKLTKI